MRRAADGAQGIIGRNCATLVSWRDEPNCFTTEAQRAQRTANCSAAVCRPLCPLCLCGKGSLILAGVAARSPPTARPLDFAWSSTGGTPPIRPTHEILRPSGRARPPVRFSHSSATRLGPDLRHPVHRHRRLPARRRAHHSRRHALRDDGEYARHSLHAGLDARGRTRSPTLPGTSRTLPRSPGPRRSTGTRAITTPGGYTAPMGGG